MNIETKTDDCATWKDGSTLVFQRWMPGPVDRLWSYLTDSDLRRTWFAAGDMTLAPGAPLELVWRNDELCLPPDGRPDGFPEEQRMESRVIAVEPLRRLTIAWGKGDVTFELEAQGDRVLLTLTHRGLDAAAARRGIAAGWHMHLAILADRAAGKQPASFWAGWLALRDLYLTRLPG